MRPVFFISDLHAGIKHDAEDPAKLRDFRVVLERARREGCELCILGDLFDFWFEWREVVPRRHLPWLEALRQAVEGGLAISLLPGNHDFKLDGMLERELGLRLPGDWERRDLLGTPAFLHHGDGLDPQERGYRLMRGVFRSAWAQWAFRWLHPDLGMAFADVIGGGDRVPVWDRANLLAYMGRAIPASIQPADRLMVMGHVHVGGRYQWKKCQVVSLPPFMLPGRGYGSWDGAEFRFHFVHEERATEPVEEKLA
jgi:UDP-2,3-diacylglucosamine hydrolase